jgi:hypothetical protein
MDICDVFLEIVRFLRLCVQAHEMIETVVFLPLPLSWVFFRLYFFWRRILRHSLLIVPLNVGWQYSYFYYPFNIMLMLLLSMNLYWFILILRIAIRKVFYGEILDDTREKQD